MLSSGFMLLVIGCNYALLSDAMDFNPQEIAGCFSDAEICLEDPNAPKKTEHNFRSNEIVLKEVTNGDEGECCYRYESYYTGNKNCESEAIPQSQWMIAPVCKDTSVKMDVTSLNNAELVKTGGDICSEGIVIDSVCDSDIESPCSYTICIKFANQNGKCCTKPSWYSVKSGNTIAFGEIEAPSCDCPRSHTAKRVLLHSHSSEITSSPTKSPSKTPTDSPTKNPSVSPTRNPTDSPTKNPSISPTKNPTVSPTKNPTISPTKNPTISPTKNPTVSPTKNPSISPTKNPTISPTKNPTVSPTKNPTVSPTKNPTVSPTKNPTISPTKNPTISPTKNPTVSPTKNPTISPTKNPTISPTKNPTISPTKNPTVSPTKNPTSSPTKNPTVSPTKQPTDSPTNNPTISPTKNPTAAPTKQPSVSPTKQPSVSPTLSPTKNPTVSPTKNPTRNPTPAPTSHCHPKVNISVNTGCDVDSLVFEDTNVVYAPIKTYTDEVSGAFSDTPNPQLAKVIVGHLCDTDVASAAMNEPHHIASKLHEFNPSETKISDHVHWFVIALLAVYGITVTSLLVKKQHTVRDHGEKRSKVMGGSDTSDVDFTEPEDLW